ncbi:ABC transporter ATP-binding protein [Jiangella asiatica]|uniref:ABC transporter ATP-binding protein n=1 Tax=Jiangella asiatica TaxID=2530372 RepID=A0A4R5DHB3_9ACTN|nr:ABC transporter ATP-binding protein [Jiangella asiatica]TDE09873.1 ABC transporter ATP-binding protein [Jiangella asiatica]
MTLTAAANRRTASDRIVFDEIGKHYVRAGDQLQVLDRCSFTVEPGEFVSVIGPSGCGKTTLLNMAAGFTAPDDGSVRVGDDVVTRPHPSRGVVFQQYAIFPWLTVARNIEFGLTLRANRRPRGERKDVVRRYLELMGLEPFASAYPKELSGGMRQRVAIARAYATDPQVLLMDEPFAALDAQTRERMQELLHETQLTERRTVLFITHSVEEAIFLSNRVVVLSARPTGVREVVDIGIPAPRSPETRLSPRFVDLRRRLEGLLRSASTDEAGARR